MNAISVYNVAKSVKDENLFSDVSFGLDVGERLGIIGKNGAGKSTFLKLIAKQLQPDEGEITINKSCRVAFLEQDVSFPAGCTLSRFLRLGDDPHVQLLERYESGDHNLMDQIEAALEADFLAALDPMYSAAEPLSLPKLTKKVFECIEANADLCRVIIGPYGDKEFARRLFAKSRQMSLKRYQQCFSNADILQIEAYFTFVTGGCFFMMDRWVRGGMVESSAELADAAEQIMERGIAFLQGEN